LTKKDCRRLRETCPKYYRHQPLRFDRNTTRRVLF
jgi:hypothetical protein